MLINQLLEEIEKSANEFNESNGTGLINKPLLESCDIEITQDMFDAQTLSDNMMSFLKDAGEIALKLYGKLN